MRPGFIRMGNPMEKTVKCFLKFSACEKQDSDMIGDMLLFNIENMCRVSTPVGNTVRGCKLVCTVSSVQGEVHWF